MRLTLVRHATLLIDIAGVRFLIDPAFDPAGTQAPIAEGHLDGVADLLVGGSDGNADFGAW